MSVPVSPPSPQPVAKPKKKKAVSAPTTPTITRGELEDEVNNFRKEIKDPAMREKWDSLLAHRNGRKEIEIMINDTLIEAIEKKLRATRARDLLKGQLISWFTKEGGSLEKQRKKK